MSVSVIRKISVGPDYKSGSMHYVVGQSVLSGTYKIHSIKRLGINEFNVMIMNDELEVVIWKSFVDMPVSVEYDIDF